MEHSNGAGEILLGEGVSLGAGSSPTTQGIFASDKHKMKVDEEDEMEVAGDGRQVREGATPPAEPDRTFLCEYSFASRGEKERKEGVSG